MTDIIIKEQLMGTGKSTRMIEDINNDVDKDNKYIIVLPYLAECHRYAGTISVGESQSPKRNSKGDVSYTGEGCNKGGREFCHPSSYSRGKLLDLERLVRAGKDIVTTHATLKNFSQDTAGYITDSGYTLVIDEELECVKIYKGLTKTRKDLLFGKYIEIEQDTGRLIWIGGDIDTPKGDWVTEAKNLCESGSLFYLNNTVLVWEYPVNFLRAFKKIVILTYLFEGSMFSSYLKHHNMKYTVDKLPRPNIDWKSLITILDHPKMNLIGDNNTALSSSWYKRHTKVIVDDVTEFLGVPFENEDVDVSLDRIQKDIYNFLVNHHKDVPSSDKMWATFKDAYKFLKGMGYSKSHVAFNCKAVNDYINRYVLAYCVNVYLNPFELDYIKHWEHKPDTDLIALSTMLQWIFRSRIRKGEPISVYIPSKRMRELLINWIENEHYYLENMQI